jgi:hypothetical protein
MDTGWMVLGGIIVALAVGFVLFARVFRRWGQPDPTSPESEQADVDISVQRKTIGT